MAAPTRCQRPCIAFVMVGRGFRLGQVLPKQLSKRLMRRGERGGLEQA